MASLVDIVSKEFIKPSSPTPHRLRHLKLSFLDQVAPPIHIPLIFFYKADQLCTHDQNGRFPALLKRTLSNVLTQFYPLAGTFCKDTFAIDCNDAGVLFVEAQVHKHLLQVLDAPNMEELKFFCLPDELETITSLLAVQVNVFKCGGIAIGVKISHIIADAMSLMIFVNAWAANCRGDAEVPQPSFGFESLFKPIDLASFGINPAASITREKLVTKRVVFDKGTLVKLKHIVASSPGSELRNPNRVEAVSTFLWRHFIQASMARSKQSSCSEKTSVAIVPVNIRGRMDLLLPDCSFGNLAIYTTAMPSKEGGVGYSDLANIFRNTIRTVNVNYVKDTLQAGDGYHNFSKEFYESFSNPALDHCVFSSWCHSGAYAVDFGWGKPTWVCPSTLPIKNTVVLMEGTDGEAIEAWTNILEEDSQTLFLDGSKYVLKSRL